MKRIRQIVLIFIGVILIWNGLESQVNAAGSGSITLKNASETVGNTVTVQGTISSSNVTIAGAKVNLTYDASALTYVSGSGGTFNAGDPGIIKYGVYGTEKSYTFSIQFKIVKAGTWGVNIASYQIVDLENAEELTITPKSATVTGKAPTTNNGGGTTNNGGNTGSNNGNNNTTKKDTNNKLSALQVYPGSLSPVFSASTTSYNMTVSEDTTEVTISATPQSEKATVTVSGGKDLKLGLNTAQVIVVAESGASRAYTITIMCGEKEQIQIDGTTKTINEDFADAEIPTGFSRTKVTYNKRQYEALVNTTGNMHLISLTNEAGATYYIYNNTTQEFYTFVQIFVSAEKYIIPMPLSSEVEAFSKNETTTLTVQDKNFDAWKLDDEFSVAYVMNQNGETALYRYDSVDGVFQRYTDVTLEVSDTEEKNLFPDKYYMYAIIGLGSLCFILLVSMIYFIASRRQRREGRKKRMIRKQEKQRIKEEKIAAKERAIAEKEAEKRRIIEEKERAIAEKQRLKEEKKLAKQKKKEQ